MFGAHFVVEYIKIFQIQSHRHSYMDATTLTMNMIFTSSAKPIPHTTINLHNLSQLKSHRNTLRHRSIVIVISNSSTKDVWRKTPNSTTQTKSSFHQPYRRKPEVGGYLDHSVDMDELVANINETTDEHQLFAVMSPYKSRQLSVRFMVTVLSRETDWQRSLALLDWMNEHALYTPSVYAYNVVLRNVLRAKQWEIAYGLFDEMRQRGLSPDRYTYSTLITQFGKEGRFDDALSWLQKMEQDHVSGDLVLYSNLIELSRKLCDYSKAISIFSRLKQSGISPDLVAYNSMINVFGKAKLFREARLLLQEMRSVGVSPDTVSYSTLLSMYAENQKYLEALSVFSEMKEVNCSPDLTTCNIMIDVYGQLDMAKEADRLFWSMRKMGIEPNVVSYNTLLRVYGEAELFGEAIHLFRLMQRKDINQNVVTYNTMIKIYGKTLEHEKANNLIQEMQNRGIEPNGITYSTIISIWDKSGKLDRAATLFQKLRSSGVEIDQVLYQTMIVAYERAGLIGHAKRLLHELKTPDNIPRATAITILAAAGRVEEATWVFRQAYNSGEIKDISVYACMVDLFSRNRKHSSVIEVFDKMRKAGYFPDSNDEGCVFPDEVHFQMLSLYGAKRDFKMVESLFERLDVDPNINKKELHLVVASIYERANRLNDASRIVDRMKHMGLMKWA
ncbi:putative tetratricopeptide-like helical domain superfamily [Helianthus annuus]|nr:putative tetratricopeptide-like helical domain superfamily [Helianthus annuus]KAJ0486425.1 putative tetratricopeptide-like helical domain superfamily [Helianthus annuus]KAJ0656982.1 putative tetratricopeptide-like helical domain superfamily [Helianthus annuus]KAJ0660573.1 putative tetratricopeptide-like helical domain superfamily [Helianthus annuus]